jgi:hypothetical protein
MIIIMMGTRFVVGDTYLMEIINGCEFGGV